MMIILTAAALAAAQPAPAPAPQAQAGQPASHAEHAAHGRMQHGQNCPCCDHDGANADRGCCAHMQQRNQHDRH